MGSLPSEMIVPLSYVLAPLAFMAGWLLRERRTRRGGHAFDARWTNELRVHQELRRLGAASAPPAFGEPSHPLALRDDEDDGVCELGATPRPRFSARTLPAPLRQEAGDIEPAPGPPARQPPAPGQASSAGMDDDGLPPLPPPVRLSTGDDEDEDAEVHFDASTLAVWPDSVRGTALDPSRPSPAPRAPDALTRLLARCLAAAVLVGLGWTAGRAIWPVDSARLGERATRALTSLPGAPEPALAAHRPPASSTDRIASAAPAVTDRSSRAVSSPTRSAATPAASPAPLVALAAGSTTTPVSAVESAVNPATPATEPKPTHSAPSVEPVAEGLVEVKAAQLCSALSTGKQGWHCDPVADTAGVGILYFYTRLRASRATKVRHVWYRDGEVRRAAELTLAVSGPEGYRTYSRMPIAENDLGNWHVELRDEADRLLHEAQVSVR